MDHDETLALLKLAEESAQAIVHAMRSVAIRSTSPKARGLAYRLRAQEELV
jgi:hypothetical protein